MSQAAAPPSRAAAGWVIAQAGRDPYIILVSIYIFAPWFVANVVGDPVIGQALIAQIGKWGGWAVMATMPVLGAAVDRLGPRKPFLALVAALMTCLAASLWFVVPKDSGLDGLGVAWVMFVGASMTWLLSAHETLHNALLVPAAGISGAARASGLGLAMGNATGVVMLVALLFGFALPGTVDWAFLPAQPLFGLDPALGEPSRLTGPIAAVLMAVGIVPLLLWSPDRPRTQARMGAALVGGLGDLLRLFREVRGNANPLLYLLARMLFTDGLTAILLFGGVFAAGVMQWGTLEMLGYAVTLSTAAVAGGLLAGRLDTWLGPRRALMAELAVLIIMEAALLGSGRARILYQTVAPIRVWDAPFFATLQELVFLGLGCGLAITVTAAYASSRTLMTRLVPPERLGAFFGLYALSGSATMWLGPLLVEHATRAGGSQAAGFIPVIGLLAVGLLLVGFVRGGGRLQADG
ncbi:MFS transporter [Sandarakinorhabdus sp.]|uniref:MFS transporter n=1 Tax=Sandarakinorhabdus sp. TaxID=1916663 RepID=UPI00334238DC